MKRWAISIYIHCMEFMMLFLQCSTAPQNTIHYHLSHLVSVVEWDVDCSSISWQSRPICTHFKNSRGQHTQNIQRPISIVVLMFTINTRAKQLNSCLDNSTMYYINEYTIYWTNHKELLLYILKNILHFYYILFHMATQYTNIWLPQYYRQHLHDPSSADPEFTSSEHQPVQPY